MDQFKFKDKWYYIAGVANKKSVAYFCAKKILEFGGKTIFSAQNEKNLNSINKLFPDSPAFILDVENPSDLDSLSTNILSGISNSFIV
jgi:enoyl-[acyl-carrier protein] reductase I